MASRPIPWVLLHGFAGAPSSWDRAIEGVEGRTILRPRLLGHGAATGAESEAGSFDEEVDRLAREIRDGLAGPARLAGYSLGGRLAYGLLARHPGLFESAVICGADPGLRDPAEREARAAWEEGWARRLEEEGLEAFCEAWEALPIFASEASADPAALEAKRRARRGHDPRALARAMRTLGLARMPSRWEALAALRLPITLVAGALDTKYVALLGALAARLPEGRLELLPGVGHDPLLAAPEAIRRILFGRG